MTHLTELINHHIVTAEVLYKDWKKSRDVIDHQVEQLEFLSLKYYPACEWYFQHDYPFKHPSIEAEAYFGPILGYDEQKNDLYVYHVMDLNVKRINLDTNTKTVVSFTELVNEGFYEDACKGFSHIEVLTDFQLDHQL